MSDTTVTTMADGVARISWGPRTPVDVVRHVLAEALISHHRVETLIDPDDPAAQRTAAWSGMRREGVMRGVSIDGEPVNRIVYARLADDLPVHEPEGFRALLNSFLPRKRAIAQLLVRDPDGRVMLCGLTYKRDWDLPGGVVEVNESPRVAVSREVSEELALDLPAGPLLLTDWLPPWSGWDDAVTLVFDGGVVDPRVLHDVVREEREISDVGFCTRDEVWEWCAEFTARRVEAALARLADPAGAPFYTESGHSVG